MDMEKKSHLEATGFRVGAAAKFLGLSAEENALVETRLALSATLKRRRERHQSQEALAQQIHSSHHGSPRWRRAILA